MQTHSVRLSPLTRLVTCHAPTQPPTSPSSHLTTHIPHQHTRHIRSPVTADLSHTHSSPAHIPRYASRRSSVRALSMDGRSIDSHSAQTRPIQQTCSATTLSTAHVLHSVCYVESMASCPRYSTCEYGERTQWKVKREMCSWTV
jgi:hypothetical protein